MTRNVTTLSEGCHYCEFLILFIVILNVIMLSVVVLSVIVLSVVAPLKIPLDFCFLFAIISLLRLYF
jgi:hypothetical protein